MCGSYIYFLADVLRENGDEDIANKFTGAFTKLIDWAAGEGDEEADAPAGEAVAG